MSPILSGGATPDTLFTPSKLEMSFGLSFLIPITLCKAGSTSKVFTDEFFLSRDGFGIICFIIFQAWSRLCGGMGVIVESAAVLANATGFFALMFCAY